MICGNDSLDTIAQESDKSFENWAHTIRFHTNRSFRPRNRAELVEIVAHAERDHLKAKAVGSLWSFTPVFSARDVVIETDDLRGEISSNVVLGWLPLTERARARVGDRRLIHVRAGTKICELNRLLHGLPPTPCGSVDKQTLDCVPDQQRALATLGGSGGQALAGVLSTSVHGGDVHLPPIADNVKAIHLVGPGGQEWWIERPDDPLTEGAVDAVESEIARLAQSQPAFAAELCQYARVRRDADLFDAALVSVGRMGIIYSVVIEVVPAFKLKETTSARRWSDLRSELGPDPARFESTVADPSTHFYNVIINPFPRSPDAHIDCRVVRRQTVSADTPNENMDRKAGDVVRQFVCGQATLSALSGGVVTAILLPVSAGLGAAIGVLLAIPFGAFFAAPLIVAKGALDVLMGLLVSPATNVAPIDLIRSAADTLYSLGLGDVFADVMSMLFDSNLDPEAGARVGVSWTIMDTYDYGSRDYCQQVESMELVFDVFATTPEGTTYLDFVDEALAIIADLHDRGIPIATVLSLRYTRGTRALIGMQQGQAACHVEIPLLKDFAGNREAMARIQDAARRHGGRPHWGQTIVGYTGHDIDVLYGERIQTWRRVLDQLIREGGGRRDTFSNPFTVRYHLEPALPRELGDCIVNLLEGL